MLFGVKSWKTTYKNCMPYTQVFFEESDPKYGKVGESGVNSEDYKFVIVWHRVVIQIGLHVAALYGMVAPFFHSLKLATFLFASFLAYSSGLGITAGAHRYWCHRSFEAKRPLQICLLICQTLAGQKSVIHWVRDHRCHHKYSDTDRDPYNRNRGFFFAHIGWMVLLKPPKVLEGGRKLDHSDLLNDPLLVFQHRYYYPMFCIICLILPAIIPVIFWNETFWNAWHYATMVRWVAILNVTFSINSAAHTYGYQPYEKNNTSTNSSFLAFLTIGEGYHNFHHAFPIDYRTSEFGSYGFGNFSSFIDLMAKVGLAYDLKTVPEKVIKARVRRTGDGTHAIWGWGDKDMPKEDIDLYYSKNI